MTNIGIMIDLLGFGVMELNGMMELNGGTNMVSIIEIMINLLVFGLMVLNTGTNMANIIESMISLLLFGQMKEWNIGLMMRELNEYL
jgi:hypothetical protein